MSIPKRRKTSAKRDSGRSHLHLKQIKLTRCQKCQEAVLPHHMCKKCGTYKNRQVLDLEKKAADKKKRRADKLKKKEEDMKEQQAMQDKANKETKNDNKKDKPKKLEV